MSPLEPKVVYAPSQDWSQAEIERLRAENEKLRGMVDALLDHCPHSECDECSRIVCPHGDALHLHHDGCPSCWHEDTAAARAALAETEPKE